MSGVAFPTIHLDAEWQAQTKAFAADLAEAHPYPRVRWITAVAFLWSVPMPLRERAAEVTIEGETPWPPAISGPHRLSWAREWCADQNSVTLKVYCLAAFEAMRPADRAAFVAYIATKAAA
jgi:hypothetical protein